MYNVLMASVDYRSLTSAESELRAQRSTLSSNKE
jgi:hypothetical protein